MVIRMLMALSLAMISLLSFTQLSMATNIHVSLDRNPVVVNESFTATFEADGSVDDDPDFSPLQQEFKILNQSQSNNMQIINGSISRKTVWSVVLMAKREGKLLLPAIHFGSDLSQQVAVIVKPASQSGSNSQEDVFLEVDIDPVGELYVQSQLIYTVRLFRAVNISQASLTEPKVENAIIQKLGDDKNYEKQHQGRHYVITERSYAIFPQQSGQLTVPPLTFQAQIMQGNYFGRMRQLHSKEIVVDVYPKAAAFPGNSAWLPATEVQLEENWPDEELIAGEAITRTIQLQVTGLTAAQIPDFNMPLPAGLKQYPDQPVLTDRQSGEGITGTRELKVAIMPTKAGSYTLPELTIPWWNVQQHRLEKARIPARTIQVKAAATTTSQPQIAQLQEADNGNADIPAATQATATASALWFWLAILFGSAWLITLAAWWRSVRYNATKEEDLTPHSTAISSKELLKAVKQACLNHQAKQAEAALQTWLSGSPELKQRLINSPDYQQASLALITALYSSEGGNWSGDQLWAVIEQLSEEVSSSKETTEHLAPLNPN